MTIELTVYFLGDNVTLSTTTVVEEVTITVVDNIYQSGGGGGAVDSVNGKTGTVVLDASDIAETSTLKWLTSTLKGYYDTAYNWVNTNGSSVLQSISDLQTAIGNRYTKSETDNLLNNKVDKVSGKGLSENDLTNSLKSSYDSAVIDKHTHGNKATLDLIEQPLTTALKTTYDGYGSQISAKANIADVDTTLFKTVTTTVVTGKTAENSIYSIPLPIDGYNYVIELYSNAHIVTYPGFTQNHRIRCGTYIAPIDGITGANAIGNQTIIFTNQGTTNGAPVYIDRKFIFKGGVSGTIFGVQTGVTEVWNTVTPTTLMSANFTTQHYLYVCFSAMNSGVFQHNFITIKLTKI